MNLHPLTLPWLDRLMPGSCALCGDDGPAPLCAACSAALFEQKACVLRCPRCATRCMPGSGLVDCPCVACIRELPAFDRTLALADYAAPLDRLVLALKFRAQLPLAAVFGQLLAREVQTQGVLTADDPGHQRILAVPLSRERLAERGFNQSHEIARALARVLKLPLSADSCARVRHTEAQAMLSLPARRVNMRGAFTVLKPQAVAGREWLLVDDVMTTGHTLAELAACLKRHGATRITNLVIARTPER